MQRGRLLVDMVTKTSSDQQEKENNEPVEETSLLLNSSPSLLTPETANNKLSENDDNEAAKVLQEINVNDTESTCPSTTESNQRKYYISPLHSDQSDFDDSDCDPHFIPGSNGKVPSLLQGTATRQPSSSSTSSSSTSSSSSSSSESSSSSSDDEEENNLNAVASSCGAAAQVATAEANASEVQEIVRGKKRVRNEANWKKKIAKTLRNTGKDYISSGKKQVPARKIGPPCGDKCRLNCRAKIDENSRQDIFNSYWSLGDLQKQRQFIIGHTTQIKPKYRYSCTQDFRKLNTAFYLQLNHTHIRVCKTFFKNTLAINDRPIATALSKKTETGFVQDELRGKHGNQRTVEPEVYASVKTFINSIPRIESHYLRAQTSREYIQCDKSLADLYRDYKEIRTKENLPFASASTFNRIFNRDFNISFHIPKKDQCDLCESFNNADEEGKQKIGEEYKSHLKEKDLSRREKENDKARVDNTIVAVYDLQAVMPLPKGQISVFYYKSRINCFNFTVSDLHAKNVECYFWNEIEGKRGAIEIGSCILNYIEKITQANNPAELDFIFYSDNCCGQQKNKYLLTAYAYATQKLNVKSITHKFLIRGHSQNEGDNVHSVIEKQVKRFLKSGPIYVPQQYSTLIQTAKKTGPPYRVNDMTNDKFVDLKLLQEQWGNNFNVNENRNQVKWHDIKVLRVEKEHPMTFFYKNSYEDENYLKVFVRNSRRSGNQPILFSIGLTPAYISKIPLAQNKKRDIKELVDKNIIPRTYYESYYRDLID